MGSRDTLFSPADLSAATATDHQAPSSQAVYLSALGTVSQGVLISDAHRVTRYVNPALEALTGYSADEMVGKSCRMLQGLNTDVVVLDALKRTLNDGKSFHGELLNYRKDGTPFWNELSIEPVFDEEGVLRQYVGVQRDVTVRRAAQAEQRLAASVFAQLSEGVLVTDAQRRIVMVNRAFTDITGYTETEALGQNPRMLSSGRQDKEFYTAMWESIDSTGSWQGEVWNRRKDGTVYPQWLSISHALDEAGHHTHYIACLRDITRHKQAEDSIRSLAHYDPLTGLPNRALLADRAEQALQRARRAQEPLALLFIDLDHFKIVNDSLGHRIGDHLLAAVAQRWRTSMRAQDTLARIGGDEFVVLLPQTELAGAAEFANKLISSASQAFHIASHELTVTPSIGIALFPEHGADFDSLSQRADAAMYRAKANGRNGYSVFSSDLQVQSARTLVIENALRRALERDQMQLHFQPQQSLVDGRIVGAEALLRWHHPDLGWVSPAEFIPLAESNGLIVPLGEWVLRTALRQLRDWRNAGLPPLVMAVNISVVQFRQRDLPELVERLLAEHGVEPHWLELELTEGVASDDPLGAIAMMTRLRGCGVRLSIDDFGTGYSSLSYLKRFKVNKLKIDQSFVRGLTEEPEDQAIVSAIIALARSLGMETIAEGVETAAQRERLSQQGCDEMQGYWFSRPLQAAAFELFARAHGQ